MKLFRRLIFSLLPEEMVQHEMNPAGMFLSFVDPKRFFSVICRKIVENYKLNLFDIWLDSFEAKVWMWDQPHLKPKEVNDYYSYATVANLNGWTFYSPANIGTALTLLVSVYVKEVFKSRHWSQFYNFLVTVNILCFVFVSRIKIFPSGWSETTDEDTQEQDYQRFVSIFFNFYRLTLQSGKRNITDAAFKDLKKELLQHIHVFFLLYRVYKKLNSLFYSSSMKDDDFYHWIFSDYAKKASHKAKIQDFVQHAQAYTKVSWFSDADEDLIKLLLPTDMMIKYVFHHKHLYDVAHNMIAKIYPPAQLDDLVMSFLKNDNKLDQLFEKLFDFREFKSSFFAAMRKFLSKTYRLGQWYEQQQEIDSFISSMESREITNEWWIPDMPSIPDALKQESSMTERFVNFYITFLAGLWVGRGDNFYMRLFYKPFLEDVLALSQDNELSQHTLMYYGWFLYQYSKNTFYYKYANDHIRQWKDQFSLPLKSNTKEVYSNMYILKLFDEHFVATCFQDINTKNLTLTITNEKLIDLFKSRLWDRISQITQFEDTHVMDIYEPLLGLVPEITPLVATYASSLATDALKKNLYTLDIRLRIDYLDLLWDHQLRFDDHAVLARMWISATLRETLLGMMLYMTHLLWSQSTLEISLHVDALLMTYLQDVLLIPIDHLVQCKDLLYELQEQYAELLDFWLWIDDNMTYIALWMRNRQDFIQDKNEQQIVEWLSGEDIVRWRWFLKNISYYNRRYVIPQ